ncbi:MAG: phosphate acyltransferase PlsX [Armatimonadetes bacterium]|nr:phosphate acyltransferase PlsX [Armatimonadota bacterium]
MKIAVDGMGGDFAPEAIVAGTVEAACLNGGTELVLVGDDARLQQALSRLKAPHPIAVHHASEVIEMQEHPAAAVRRKRDASVSVAVALVKEGKADAVVTAGNTGAAMAVAAMKMGRIPGIERPGIASPIPTVSGKLSILVDAGANVDCEPKNLVQYAIMGSVYAEKVLHIESPRIGLLNIGEENTKGNEMTKATYNLLEGSGLNFIGNIEGKDICLGTADVIVCDGFVGNVVLKVGEGVAQFVIELLKRFIKDSPFYRRGVYKLGILLLYPALKYLRRTIDYSEYGGAPLLGVDGVCIISHGRSDAKAIANAIKIARETAETGVIPAIKEHLGSLKI